MIEIQLDDPQADYGNLAESLCRMLGILPTRDLDETLELMRLACTDWFDSWAYIAYPRRRACCPMFAEANMDALRLWVLPMPRGQRYSAVIHWSVS